MPNLSKISSRKSTASSCRAAVTSFSSPRAALSTLDVPPVTLHSSCHAPSPTKCSPRSCYSKPRMRHSASATSSLVRPERRRSGSMSYPRSWMSKSLCCIWITSTPSCRSCRRHKLSTWVCRSRDPSSPICTFNLFFEEFQSIVPYFYWLPFHSYRY